MANLTHMQQKVYDYIVSCIQTHVKGKVVLDALLRQDGASRGHVAHNGHPVLGSGKLGQGDGPALPAS